MNPVILYKWLKNNISLFLLLLAMLSLVLALGQAIRGLTWVLLMPVAMAAVLCGWLIGVSRIKGWQLTGSLVVLGMIGVFLYVTGLVAPIGNLLLSTSSVVTQIIFRLVAEIPVNFTSLNASWSALIQQLAAVLARLGAWGETLAAGKVATDSVVTGLAWSTLLWLVEFWSGWYLSRKRQALGALAPGALVLALVSDYTGNKIGLLLLYLAILLLLIGVSRFDGLRASWQHRGMDYSDSIAFDSMFPIFLSTIFLVGIAAITPSFSWQDLAERVRQESQGGDDRVAESFGLQENPQEADVYGSRGLARHQQVGAPPDLSQDLVFTVRTGELSSIPDPNVILQPPRHYWRAMTYDIYTGAGWSSSQVQNTTQPAGTALLEVPLGYKVVRQQLHMVSDQNERVYWTGTLVQADVELEISWRSLPPANSSPISPGDMLGTLINASDYSLVSVEPQVGAVQLRAAGTTYPPEVTGSYLHLPESVPGRVLLLARELTQTPSTPYDRALAIETYLRKFPYSLEVGSPPPGQDVVDYFLFTLQKGYCEYYASAMVVLARAVDLPARIVYGYASGTYNPTNAQYEIRQENAHAWPEIYFPGIGWVEFEPTSSLPEIFRQAGNNSSQPSPETAPDNIVADWLKQQWRSFALTIFGRVLLALLGLMGLFTIWQAGEIWFLYLLPTQRTIRSLYARLEKNSARLLPGLIRGHTPHELKAALVHGLEKMEKRWFRPAPNAFSREVEQIVSLFETQIYSQKAPERLQVRAGIKAWARLRWQLRIMKGFQQLNKKNA
jgi:transglutaminase-like putative cysteine protease